MASDEAFDAHPLVLRDDHTACWFEGDVLIIESAWFCQCAFEGIVFVLASETPTFDHCKFYRGPPEVFDQAR